MNENKNTFYVIIFPFKVEDSKERWRYMRDRYVKDVGKYRRSLRHYDQEETENLNEMSFMSLMAFLNPYIRRKPKYSIQKFKFGKISTWLTSDVLLLAELLYLAEVLYGPIKTRMISVITAWSCTILPTRHPTSKLSSSGKKRQTQDKSLK